MYPVGGATRRCTLPTRRGVFGIGEVELLKSEAELVRESRWNVQRDITLILGQD